MTDDAGDAAVTKTDLNLALRKSTDQQGRQGYELFFHSANFYCVSVVVPGTGDILLNKRSLPRAPWYDSALSSSALVHAMVCLFLWCLACLSIQLSVRLPRTHPGRTRLPFPRIEVKDILSATPDPAVHIKTPLSVRTAGGPTLDGEC